MFSIFKKRTDKSIQKARDVRPRYIYKPNENAMAFRLEYREDLCFVYPGWSKTVLFKIEGDKIYSAADEKLQYIIIGKDVFDAAGEKRCLSISDRAVYDASGKILRYELRDSITVQGTL